MNFFFNGLKRAFPVLGLSAASVLLFPLTSIQTPSLADVITPEWEAAGKPVKKTQKLYVDVDASLHALEPSLVSGGSSLYLAWIEMDSHGVPLVQLGRWNGRAWEKDPHIMNIDPDRKASDLSISASGESPVLAWVEEARGFPPRIFTKHLRNGEWVSGENPINNNLSFQAANPVVSASKGVSPFLAWSERDKKRVFQLYVKQFDQSGWISIGQESLNQNPSRDAVEADLVLDGERPFITWMEPSETGIYQVFVKEWTGSSWEPLGGSLNVHRENHAVKPAIEVFNQSPHVSWIEQNEAGLFNVRVKRWSGKKWVPIGPGLNRNLSRHALSPAMKATDKNLYLAWSEFDESSRPRIFLKRWDGKKWTDLNPPPQIDGSPFVGSPSLELNGTDLYLAWKETNLNGFYQIRVNRLKTK